MFHDSMIFKPRLRITCALLLAGMLSLQGAAAMPDCGQFDSTRPDSPSAGPHDPVVAGAEMPTTPQHEHCVHGAAATHQHGCSAHCCAVAIAYTQILWAAPRSAAPDIAAAVLWPSPTVELDRLDRPPRSV